MWLTICSLCIHLGLLGCKREGDLVATFRVHRFYSKEKCQGPVGGATAESFIGKRRFCELPRVAGLQKGVPSWNPVRSGGAVLGSRSPRIRSAQVSGPGRATLLRGRLQAEAWPQLPAHRSSGFDE